MDGRVQIPAINWIKENHGVDHVDMITEAGMNGHLADSNNSIDEITRKINISIDKNNATMIVIVGHYDCKGNPVGEDEHKDHIRTAVERISNEYSDLDVIGLWINSEWEGEQI